MSTWLIFALVCAIAAIVYGIASIGWIMKQPAGNERMREIALAKLRLEERLGLSAEGRAGTDGV